MSGGKDPLGLKEFERSSRRRLSLLSNDPVEFATQTTKDSLGITMLENNVPSLLNSLGLGDQGGETGPGAETPELPKRDEVIADLLSQQLFTLENRRKTRTVTSQGDSTPLASTVLFGR